MSSHIQPDSEKPIARLNPSREESRESVEKASLGRLWIRSMVVIGGIKTILMDMLQ